MMPTLRAPQQKCWVRLSVWSVLAGVILLGTSTNQARAQEPPELPATNVTAARPSPIEPALPVLPPPLLPPSPFDQSGRTLPVENSLVGPQSASQGVITQLDLQNRPWLRTEEFLENIPGLIVTQHSGSPVKANSLFLRGFSLDNGTDFSVWVDDVPMNLPTNPHGQGYLDLNFLIPEIISTIDFNKGPYYAQVGDFSSVGYASIHLADSLPYGFAKVEAGKWDWYRAVVADSGRVGAGTLLYAVQASYSNGPFISKDHANQYIANFRWTVGDANDGFRLSTILYNGQSNLNNQIPLRAVLEGLTTPFGNEDTSDFIVTSRFILNGQWWHRWGDGGITRANVFGEYYSLNIFSNFTFFLEDPVNGDQIDQIDRRWITGANISHEWKSRILGNCAVNTVGLQVRNDYLPLVALHHTANRQFLDGLIDDQVNEFSAGLWLQSAIKWGPKVRTVFGCRGDFFNVDVKSFDTPANSGSQAAALFSPKASLVLGPWNKTEFYLNGGYSFHSNDARGVTQTVDLEGNPIGKVPLLVRCRGAEVGVRTQAIRNLTSTVALWQLHLASELIFDGDEGATEPARSSDRYGIEWSNTYRVNSWLTINADYTWSHGRLLGVDPETPGQHIPEAITTVFSGGPSIVLPSGWFANLKFRYWGPRALVEDNSAHSRATQLFEMEAGYQCQRYTAAIQLLNLFNSNGHDIDFFYTTRLQNEPPAGVADYNFKPLEPFAVRFTFTMRW